MSRYTLHAIVLSLLLWLVPGAAHGQVAPTDDTIAVAHEVGVDELELQGAVNTTALPARDYLIAAGELAAPEPPVQQIASIGTFGLDGYLLRVARCESGLNPRAVGRLGEIGLFQLHPAGLLPLFYSRGYTNAWDGWQQAAFARWAFYTAGLARHWSCR